MLLITALPERVDVLTLCGKARDTLTLTWEERRWTRKRVTTGAGREVALALPTGTVLEPGRILAVEPEWYLVVEARTEPLLAIFPETYEAALRIAFDVGNRHLTLALDGDALLVPDEAAIAQLAGRLGVRWERREAVYAPLGDGPDD